MYIIFYIMCSGYVIIRESILKKSAAACLKGPAGKGMGDAAHRQIWFFCVPHLFRFVENRRSCVLGRVCVCGMNVTLH